MMEKQSLSNWEECSVSQGSWKLKLVNGKASSLGVEAWIHLFALNNYFALVRPFPHLQGRMVRIHNSKDFTICLNFFTQKCFCVFLISLSRKIWKKNHYIWMSIGPLSYITFQSFLGINIKKAFSLEILCKLEADIGDMTCTLLWKFTKKFPCNLIMLISSEKL